MTINYKIGLLLFFSKFKLLSSHKTVVLSLNLNTQIDNKYKIMEIFQK